MKKILFFYVFCLFAVGCIAQHAGEWVNLTTNPKGTYFYNFVAGDDQSTAIVVTLPQGTETSGSLTRIRKYNEDFSSYQETPLPENNMQKYWFMGFSDYIVLTGSRLCDVKMPKVPDYTCEQLIMGISPDGNELFKQEVHLISEKRTLDQEANLYSSSDKSKLIVVSTESINTSDESSKHEVSVITVYNDNLNIIWLDTIVLEEVLGKGVTTRSCVFDYTTDGKLLLLVDRTAIKSKNIPTSIDIYVYDTPGHIAFKESQAFDYEWISFKHILLDDGCLYISGILKKPYSEDAYTRLFTIKKNCSLAGIESYKEILLNKAFFTAWPECAPQLEVEICPPREIIQMTDGILYIGLYGVEYENIMQCKARGIILIKFGNDGGLQWVKMIKRYCALPSRSAIFKAYNMGTNVILFYGDKSENITNTKPEIMETNSFWGLGYATISPDGTIVKSVLDDRVKDQTHFDLSSLYRISEDRFVIKGNFRINNVENTFSRIIQF